MAGGSIGLFNSWLRQELGRCRRPEHKEEERHQEAEWRLQSWILRFEEQTTAVAKVDPEHP